jgi:3-methyladenine DNA glycosylase AlkD
MSVQALGQHGRIKSEILSELRGLAVANTPSVRAVRRRYSKLLAAESPQAVLAIAGAVLEDGGWPERVVAYELVAEHPTAMTHLTPAIVDRWAKDLGDWGSIDLFGVTIAGPAWRQGRLTDVHVMRWAKSKNRWRRRLALVATVPLNSRARGGAGDAARTLAICHALMRDRDDMVVKALSWALRELAKREPTTVGRFLREMHEPLAPRVLREASAKLETGRKIR